MERVNAANWGDSDGDGLFDWYDNDSDNDGVSDLQESGISQAKINALDSDRNGAIDAWNPFGYTPIGGSSSVNSAETRS